MQRSLVHRLQHHLALRVLCSGHVPGVPPTPPPALTAIGQPRVCTVQTFPGLSSAPQGPYLSPWETYSHHTRGHPGRGLGITRVNSFPLAAPGRLREGPQHSPAQPSSGTGPGQRGGKQSRSGFDTQSQLTKFMALLRDIFRGFRCQQKALGWL